MKTPYIAFCFVVREHAVVSRFGHAAMERRRRKLRSPVVVAVVLPVGSCGVVFVALAILIIGECLVVVVVAVAGSGSGTGVISSKAGNLPFLSALLAHEERA